MSYNAPLSERIRIQLEILCENTADCISNITSNYKKPVLILCGLGVLLTMRASRKGIKTAKMGGIMGSSGGYGGAGGYGASSAYGGAYGSSAKKKSLFSRLMGKGKKTSSYGGYGSGAGGYGGYGASTGAAGSSMYGGAGGLSSGYGGASGSTYGAGAGSTYGAGGAAGLSRTTGMGGATGGAYGSTMGGAGGASAYGGGASSMSTMGGAMGGATSSFGGGATSSFGGGAMGGAASSFGGAAAGGKTTATLADSNPTSIVTLDPSVHFYDYGGASSFSGQIETVQAYDAPNFVSQVLNQPGQNKVLIIDGGGIRPDTGAVFDSDMASAALRNGWKGVIVHGVVRNIAQLSRTQIGVKALGTSPVKGKGQMGQKSVPASIGSTQLQPGWWVYADGDGVVISQTDISGGSFGGASGGFGAGASTMGGGFGSTAMGGASSTMGGAMGGSTFGSQTSTMGGASGGFGSTAGTMCGGAAGGLRGGYGGTPCDQDHRPIPLETSPSKPSPKPPPAAGGNGSTSGSDPFLSEMKVKNPPRFSQNNGKLQPPPRRPISSSVKESNGNPFDDDDNNAAPMKPKQSEKNMRPPSVPKPLISQSVPPANNSGSNNPFGDSDNTIVLH